MGQLARKMPNSQGVGLKSCYSNVMAAQKVCPNRLKKQFYGTPPKKLRGCLKLEGIARII